MFFAAKRLTNSDLGFFKHLYDSRVSGSNQKSINLNATPFRTAMYPGLREGREYAIDLRILGPRDDTEHRLRRKIVRSENSKNWRLDGEFIHDPEDSPDRYHRLKDGDLAVMRFDGEGVPEAVRLLLIGSADSPDQHRLVNQLLAMPEGGGSMIMLTSGRVEDVVEMLSSPWIARDFLMDEALIEELEAYGGIPATARGGTSSAGAPARSRPKVPRSQLSDVQEDMAEVGWLGEVLVDTFLTHQRALSKIQDFSWVSLTDAYAPYDFRVVEIDGSETRLEVKTTRNDFRQPFFLSSAEAAAMVLSGEHYRVLRLYRLEPLGADARYVTGLRRPLVQAIEVSAGLPAGVSVRGYAIDLGSIGQGGEAFRLDADVTAGAEEPAEGAGGS